MANRVLVAGPYPGPWLVSSLCGLQVWLWSSQSCSVVACPEPHAASLPISSSLPAPTSPAHGDVPAWSLGRLLNAPFLSPSWTEPGLTAQPLSQRVWLPGNSMESNIQTGPLRKSSDLGLLRGAPSFSEPGREPPQMCSPQGARRVGTGEQGGNDLPYPIGGYRNEFKSNKIKNSAASHTGHVSNAQSPHMGSAGVEHFRHHRQFCWTELCGQWS